MPFGLHNAAATFQRLVDRVLGDRLGHCCFAYLDDIVIISKSFDEHLELLREVLGRIRDAGLKINQEKSKFCRRSLEYLGHVVTGTGIAVSPSKVDSILKYPSPVNVKQLRSFLGLVSWYRRFVPNFSLIVLPLTKLLKKDSKWAWTDSCQRSFDDLKSKLVSAPILVCPDFNKPLVLQTDASFSGLGAVLSQEVEGKEHVIAFASRSLNETEKRYAVIEKELLAILWAIRKFRPYLEGYHFSVITDHSALRWLNSLSSPSGRLARWAMELQEYSFEVIHRKGVFNVVADALSRLPDSKDTEAGLAMIEVADTRDSWYLRRLEQVKDCPQKWPDWKVDDGRLYHLRLDQLNKMINQSTDRWKLVVPAEYREPVLIENHDRPMAGHLGITKTFVKISQLYYWPGLFRDVVRYVRRCKTCQLHKVEQRKPPGRMGVRRPEEPWVTVSADLLGPYPRSKKGNTYIVVFQDYFTKWVECRPLRIADAKSVVEAFHQLIVLRWGVPKFLLCDNGPQCVSNLLMRVAEAYGMQVRHTPPYTPQANPVERVNRVLKTMIACYLTDRHVDWDRYLSEFTFAMNTAEHAATGFSPAYLNYGRELTVPTALESVPVGEMKVQPTLHKAWAERMTQLSEVKTLVKSNLEEAYS
jgi:hypothetical protein